MDPKIVKIVQHSWGWEVRTYQSSKMFSDLRSAKAYAKRTFRDSIVKIVR